jgi:hypothetical protein
LVRIASEAEWLSCDQPQELAYFTRGRVDARRFRWLASAWGGRIRKVFEPDDLPWFDAFAAWVAGTGPHPAEVCRHPDFSPLDRPREETFWARRYAEAIRQDDPLSAAAYAGLSASEDYPFVPLPRPDFAHTHRGRAAAKRAAVKAREDAHREAWWAAKAEHESRVRRECCDQFRDVAGNPFRPVAVRSEWRTSTVLALARGIAAESAFDRLPILADALQDAGCEDSYLLSHCRDAGLHVRGCWIVESLSEGAAQTLNLPRQQTGVELRRSEC